MILIGTASWTDDSLVDSGRFYPADVRSPEARLRYYAARFPLVEVDSSFYALPSAPGAERWAERTPAGFVFDVKAFRIFTQHQTPPKFLPRDIREALGAQPSRNVYYRDVPPELRDELWRRFAIGIEPLRRAGKLGVVLFQFAPWFVFGRAAFEHIAECVARLPGVQVAVEFRNKSWFGEACRDAVFGFEREHGIAHVVVDEPQGCAASIPAIWQATTPQIAVVRLHGRNREMWQAKGLASSAARFDYLYAEDELRQLAGRIRDLDRDARQVHVLFNNCYGDYAPRNAMQMRLLLPGGG